MKFTISPEAALYEMVSLLEGGMHQGENLCPVCSLVDQSVQRSMKALYSELINDPLMREGWRKSKGFCAQHALLASNLGDGLGTAILYADIASLLTSEFGAKTSRLARSRAAATCEKCMACVISDESECRHIEAFADGLLRDASLWETLTDSSCCFCLTHAQALLSALSGYAAGRWQQIYRTRLKALEADLREYVRKCDYRFADEQHGEERDAWLRALELLKR